MRTAQLMLRSLKFRSPMAVGTVCTVTSQHRRRGARGQEGAAGLRQRIEQLQPRASPLPADEAVRELR